MDCLIKYNGYLVHVRPILLFTVRAAATRVAQAQECHPSSPSHQQHTRCTGAMLGDLERNSKRNIKTPGEKKPWHQLLECKGAYPPSSPGHWRPVVRLFIACTQHLTRIPFITRGLLMAPSCIGARHFGVMRFVGHWWRLFGVFRPERSCSRELKIHRCWYIYPRCKKKSPFPAWS